MAAPNLGSLILHAAGKVSAAGVLSDGANVLQVVRNGAGSYNITMGTAIDPTQRHESLTVRDNAGAIISTDPAQDSDTVFRVLTFSDAGAAKDAAFSFSVTRTSVPPQ